MYQYIITFGYYDGCIDSEDYYTNDDADERYNELIEDAAIEWAKLEIIHPWREAETVKEFDRAYA